ncbi:MAG: hypothetical protein KIH69_005020 [Anaerolineae bacterium]|nr:hypothetical protein [Anaerolineae bacterium]
MKELIQTDVTQNKEMKPEYDLKNMKGGVRGKYYQAYHQGHTVQIHRADGSILIQNFNLEDGAVVIAPDVREYFPDAEAVNEALRCLIPLLAKQPKVRLKAQ